MELLRYLATACQTDQPSPLRRSEMKRNTARLLPLLDQAVVGASSYFIAHPAIWVLTGPRGRRNCS